jgi:hypothetical protein
MAWQFAGKLGLPVNRCSALVGHHFLDCAANKEDRAADSLRKGAGLARVVDRRLGREAIWAPG